MPFCLEKDLLRDAVDLAGWGLSLFELELCELDLGLSPFVDEEVVSALFERKERLSGMFWSPGPSSTECPQRLLNKFRLQS